jgi:hypothetical protein
MGDSMGWPTQRLDDGRTSAMADLKSATRPEPATLSPRLRTSTNRIADVVSAAPACSQKGLVEKSTQVVGVSCGAQEKLIGGGELMTPAWSYWTVFDALERKFEARRRAGRKWDVILTGLLFARPSNKLVAEQILPELGYFHHRSGENVDFFCAGFSRYTHGRGHSDEKKIPSVTGPEASWFYSEIAFNEFRRELAAEANWQFSGDPELVLTNAKFDTRRGRTLLDFGRSTKLNLEKAKTDGAIASVPNLFEKIFRFVETQPGNNATWGLSDKLALDAGQNPLWNLVAGCLPEPVRKDPQRVRHFLVTDLSAK